MNNSDKYFLYFDFEGTPLDSLSEISPEHASALLPYAGSQQFIEKGDFRLLSDIMGIEDAHYFELESDEFDDATISLVRRIRNDNPRIYFDDPALEDIYTNHTVLHVNGYVIPDEDVIEEWAEQLGMVSDYS